MTEMNQERLDGIVRLDVGKHNSPSQGMCVMEAVSYVSGLPYSDHPPCTCPALASYCRTLNDHIRADQRHRLIKYIPHLVGTAGDEAATQARLFLFADRAVRAIAPMALEAIGLEGDADSLRDLEPIVDAATAKVGAVAAFRATIAAATHASATGGEDATARSAAARAVSAAGESAAAAAAHDTTAGLYAAYVSADAAYVKWDEAAPWEAIWDAALETLDTALAITGEVAVMHHTVGSGGDTV